MKASYFFQVLGLSGCGVALAFNVGTPAAPRAAAMMVQSSSSSSSSDSSSAPDAAAATVAFPVSRRAALVTGFGSVLAAATATTLPGWASAAVDVEPLENLSGFKEALDAIKSLDLLISDRNYQGIRSTLRSPPAGNVRKDVVAILASMQEGKNKSDAQNLYSALKVSLEKMDLLARKGAGGEKVNDKELFRLHEEANDLGARLLQALSP